MESERITRKNRIDPLLKSLGWKIVPFDENCPLDQLSNCAIEEYETENGPADYVLCVDGRILAVVVAKKLTLGPQNVLTQAERYSLGLAPSKLQSLQRSTRPPKPERRTRLSFLKTDYKRAEWINGGEAKESQMGLLGTSSRSKNYLR